MCSKKHLRDLCPPRIVDCVSCAGNIGVGTAGELVENAVERLSTRVKGAVFRIGGLDEVHSGG